MKLKFIDINQFNTFFPTNGPNRGGTPVTVNIGIDQSRGNIGWVYCWFPGYSDFNAILSPPYSVICVTPILKEGIDNVKSYSDYAIVKVSIVIQGVEIKSFGFTYNKNVRIIGFEPPHGLYSQSWNLIVVGTNFHSHIQDYMRCQFKFEFSSELPTYVPAVYINNQTMSCLIPSLPSMYTTP